MILLNRNHEGNHEGSLEDYFFQCNNTQRKRYSGEKANEELLKLKYFTMPKKKPNLQKNPLKRNQNLSRYYNSRPNLKFQHRPKYHLSKILI
jgi:hypothetical protein